MNFDANVAVFYQLETDFTRIHLGCEIKSLLLIQRTTVLVLFSRNIVACVAIILTGLRKQTEVTLNKAVVGKVRLQGFGRDLNTVTIKRHEIDAVVLEMERRFGDDPVVSVVVHHTDHRSSRQLPQKQVFLGDASISSRHSKALDFYTSERVFCSAVLQGFDMSKLYGWVGFYYLRANKVTSFKDTLFCAWSAFPCKQKGPWIESNASVLRLRSTSNDFEKPNQYVISQSYQFFRFLLPKLCFVCSLCLLQHNYQNIR